LARICGSDFEDPGCTGHYSYSEVLFCLDAHSSALLVSSAEHPLLVFEGCALN
jgi:hypothetical protein